MRLEFLRWLASMLPSCLTCSRRACSRALRGGAATWACTRRQAFTWEGIRQVAQVPCVDAIQVNPNLIGYEPCSILSQMHGSGLTV